MSAATGQAACVRRSQRLFGWESGGLELEDTRRASALGFEAGLVRAARADRGLADTPSAA
jgi:hypothetical protein